MKLTSMLAPYLPILTWGRTYNRGSLTNDLTAAVIVTIMLIPQSLAYAMLAGLPPQMGLYASILPITLYAIFGTSRSLAVGPVAVVSLLTAASISRIAAPAVKTISLQPSPWPFCQVCSWWQWGCFVWGSWPISCPIPSSLVLSQPLA